MSRAGGRESLTLALNVLIDTRCEGCLFHNFPYEAKLPIMENGKYKTREFTSKDDIWDVISLLIEEAESFNRDRGNRFDVFESIKVQLPFFACSNVFLNQFHQNDISRYAYCEKFNVPAYNGSYGEQPYLWIQKSFIIANYIAKKQNKKLEKDHGKHKK